MFSFGRLFFSWVSCMIQVFVWPWSPAPVLVEEQRRDGDVLPGVSEAD